MSNEQGYMSANDFEALMRQHAESRAVERMRTLDEHDAFLRTLGTGDADYMARRSYMHEHGLEYRDGPGGMRVLERSGHAPHADSLREYRQAQEQRIANRSTTTPLESYPEYMQRRAQEAAMFKDRPLVDALCARLAGYCGEGGRNEGVVEALDRLLGEIRAARQGPTSPPPERAVTIGEMCSGTDGRGDCEYKTGHAGPHSPGVPPSSPEGQRLNGLGLHRYHDIAQARGAPGKMFSKETILGALRGQKAALEHGPSTEDPILAAQHRLLAASIHIVENLE